MSLLGSKKQNEIDRLIGENDELKNQLHTVLLKHGSHEELEKNLIQAKKELADLLHRSNSLAQSIESLDTGRSEKEKYLGELNSKILELEDIKENLHSTIAAYGSQVSILEERARELDEKMTRAVEIETKLAEASEKKEKLDRDIAEKEQSFAYLSTIEREIQAELENERNSLEAVKAETSSMHGEIQMLNESFENLQNNIARIKEEEESLKLRINNYSEEELRKSAVIKNLDDKIQLNEEIKNNLENNLAELVARLNISEKAYFEHSQKRDELQNELLELTKERDSLESKLGIAKEQLGVFNAEAEKHTTLLAELGNEIRKIEAKKDSLNKEIEDLEIAAEEKTADVEEKKLLLDALELGKKEIEQSNLNLSNEFGSLIEKYMTDFEDTRKIHDELEEALTAKKEEALSVDKDLLEKKAGVDAKRNELELLSNEYSRLSAEADKLKAGREDLIESISSLRENIASYTARFTSLRYETENMQMKKSDLQRDFAYMMTQISREYSEAEGRLKSLNESVSAADKKLFEINNSIAELNRNNGIIETEAEADIPDMELNSEDISPETGNGGDEPTPPFTLPDGFNDD